MTFWFNPGQRIHYSAGQFIELQLPTETSNGASGKHEFTLSSSPTESALAITTQIITRPSHFKKALIALRPGDNVSISEPIGDFVLPKDPTIPLLFIAGGIGITPLRSIATYLRDTNQHRPIQLIYSVKTSDELVFLDLIQAAGIKVRPIITQQGSNGQSKSGRLQAEQIPDLIDNLNEKLIYISGREQFVDSIASGLRAQGVKRTAIIADSFRGYK